MVIGRFISATIFLNKSFSTTDCATAAPDTPNIPTSVLIIINPISPLTSINGFNISPSVVNAPVIVTNFKNGSYNTNMKNSQNILVAPFVKLPIISIILLPAVNPVVKATASITTIAYAAPAFAYIPYASIPIITMANTIVALSISGVDLNSSSLSMSSAEYTSIPSYCFCTFFPV